MYKTLEGKMVEKGIATKDVADRLNISERAFRNKLRGISDFTWSQACIIQEEFFPEVSKEELFRKTAA